MNNHYSKPVELTNDQQKAYDELITFIKAPFNYKDYKRALIGAAGTGKTFLVKSLIDDCGLSYSSIGLSAPTHKAARVLKENVGNELNVNTLQSDLGLRLNFNVEDFDYNNPPFDPKGKIKLTTYKLYIVDEASMINQGLCKFLEDNCKTFQCKLIYIGDSSQLAPVNDKKSYAFTTTKSYTLRQIVRQGDNNPISKLLEILRDDIEHHTFNFLSYISLNPYKFNEDGTKGYCILNKNDFKEQIKLKFDNEDFKKNTSFVKIIAYTNKCVSSWNKFVRNNIIKDATSIIDKDDLFISYTTIVNVFNEAVIKNSEEYIVHDIVNYTHPDYNLKGYMVRLIPLYGGGITNPLFILDHSDKKSLINYVTLSKTFISKALSLTGSRKASAWKDYYNFKDSCLLLINIANKFNKIMYPRNLDYGFSLTSHKSQGSTFENVFVDLNDMLFDKNGIRYTNVDEINRRLYVACSRAKNKLYLQYGK